MKYFDTITVILLGSIELLGCEYHPPSELHCRSLAIDEDGNLHLMGIFRGIVDIGQDSSESGTLRRPNGASEYSDWYLASFTPRGELLWATFPESLLGSWAYGFALDDENNSYVAGMYSAEIDYGDGESLAVDRGNNPDGSIVSYSSTGDLRWVKTIKGVANENIYSITVEPEGDLYIIGAYRYTIDFGEEESQAEGFSFDVFVTSYSRDGDFLWSQQYGGPEEDYGNAITYDGNGNIYITGEFRQSIPFGDDELISNGEGDIFLASLTTSGEYRWSLSFGGVGYDIGLSLAADPSGNIVLLGYNEDPLQLADTNIGSPASENYFLACFSMDGEPLWATEVFFSVGPYNPSMAFDSEGNILLIGSIESNLRFAGEEHEVVGEKDVVLVAFSPEGEELWSNHYGGKANDVAHSIVVSDDDDIYLTGDFLSDPATVVSDFSSLNSGDRPILLHLARP